jgi:hypothetical protein
MRFHKQRGFLPTILYIVGLGIHILFIGGTLPYLFSALFVIFSEGITLRAVGSFLELLLGMAGLVWSIPLVIGSFFVCAFPKIRITKDGIEYCTYMIFCSRIKWNEINGVIELGKGYKAITILRPGFALTNGLYSNRIYGDIVKSKLPVILISPHLEDRDVFFQQIKINQTLHLAKNNFD